MFKEKLEKLKEEGFEILNIENKSFLVYDFYLNGNKITIYDYFLIDYNKEILYKCNNLPYENENLEELSDNFKIINLNELVAKKFKEKSVRVLKEYLEENKNNLNYFNPKVGSYFSTYHNKVFMNYDYEFLNYFQIANEISMEELIESKCKHIYFNIEKLSNSDLIFNHYQFDIDSENILDDDKEFLENNFNEIEKNMLLASKQFSEGLTPNIYNKIKEIKEFLEGCQTINVILKDGTSYKANSDRTLVEFDKQRINCFRLKGAKDDVPLADIKLLKYGRKELLLESEKLNLEQLKHPIIEKFYKICSEGNDIYVKSNLKLDFDYDSNRNHKRELEELIKEQASKNIILEKVSSAVEVSENDYLNNETEIIYG